MTSKNNIRFIYDYKKVKKLGVILMAGGVFEILISLITGKTHFMIVGLVAIFASLQNLKPVTKEEMELKSLTIDDNGISLESNNNTKSIKWANVKSVKEYTPDTPKNAKLSVNVVTDTNESINFSYKNFIKIKKIRNSLKYFCNVNKVETAIK